MDVVGGAEEVDWFGFGLDEIVSDAEEEVNCGQVVCEIKID